MTHLGNKRSREASISEFLKIASVPSVGRDLKAIAQMSLFALQPYLTSEEMEIRTTLLNVRLFNDELKLNTDFFCYYRILYCDVVRQSLHK